MMWLKSLQLKKNLDMQVLKLMNGKQSLEEGDVLFMKNLMRQKCFSSIRPST